MTAAQDNATKLATAVVGLALVTWYVRPGNTAAKKIIDEALKRYGKAQ